MDARREPRFSIYGSIKVTSLSRPERVLDCVLLDISATGVKLIAPESLPLEDILTIEAEDHLALADVRYTQPRGDKFTIGCERIHVLNKTSLPNETAKAEQIRLLIEDYRNRMREGMATPRPDTDPAEAARLDRQLLELSTSTRCSPAPPPLTPSTGSFATREQLLDAAVVWVIEHWDKIPASPHEGPAGRSEIVDRLAVHLAEQLRARTTPPPPPVLPRRPAAEKVPQPPKVRRWRLPVGLAVAAIFGWGLSAIFWSYGSTGAARQEPPSTPASLVRHAQVKVVEPTWLIVTSDGKRLFNKKLSKNDVREIEFSDKALLQVGNARGVEITLDGKSIGRIGGRGQARLVELSANGFRLLPVN
jgi:hypothetical protein